MTSEQWFIQAIPYFDGIMTSEEARAFEKETAANEELSELMHLWIQTVTQALAYEKYRSEIEALAATHQRIRKDFSGTNNDRPKNIRIWKWVAAAAVLTGIMLIGNMLLRKSEPNKSAVNYSVPDSLKKTGVQRTVTDSSTPSPLKKNHTDLQALYAQNFAPDKVPDDPNGSLDDAYFYYASGQYKDAIAAIDSVHNKQLTRGRGEDASTKLFAEYYKALSLMSLGNMQQAIPLLKQVASSDDVQLKSKAQWYLSLAYLKQNEPDIAITTLEKISGGPYKNKSIKVLNDLRK